jgi:transcriptional regulator with XRE-family HTH domain
MAQPPNRLREFRKARGLSSERLGELAGTSGNTIRRLERGPDDRGMELTQYWMQTLAPLLGVMPADLMTAPILAERKDEVVAADDDPLAAALNLRNLRVYKVTETGHSLGGIGIKPGDVLVVDEADERITHLKSLDVVIARVTSPEDDVDALVLREYVAPDLLITNTPPPGVIRVGRTSDTRIQIKGVAIRK